MIFEENPLCMTQEAMKALLNIADWYASLGGTFIKMFGGEKPLHALPRFSTYNLSCKRLCITPPQGYEHDYIGGRRYHGLLFLCRLDCMRSKA